MPRENEPQDAASDSPSRVKLGPRASIARVDLRLSYSRSGGPGGQNVNKLNTKAELRVRVADIEGLTDRAQSRLRSLAGQRLTIEDEIVITCDEHRSQRRNREGAIERLRRLVAESIPEPKVRRKRKPSRAMIERRLDQKRRRSESKSRRTWQGE